MDNELAKIESFYLDREAEMQLRSNMLREQIEGLKEHQKLIQVDIRFIFDVAVPRPEIIPGAPPQRP